MPKTTMAPSANLNKVTCIDTTKPVKFSTIRIIFVYLTFLVHAGEPHHSLQEGEEIFTRPDL